jgi:CRP-like cAMP-binding protein
LEDPGKSGPFGQAFFGLFPFAAPSYNIPRRSRETLMLKIFFRPLTFLLVPCLVVASGPSPVARLTDHRSRITGHDSFTSQAVSPADIAAFTGPLTGPEQPAKLRLKIRPLLEPTPEEFSGIPPSEIEPLMKSAPLVQFADGQPLFLQGDSAHTAFYLTSGLVKIYQMSRNGLTAILRIGAPGDFLGIQDMYRNGKQTTTAQALGPVVARAFDRRVIAGLRERFQLEMATNLGKVLYRHHLELNARFREMATQPVHLRMAHLLVRLARLFGPPVNGEVTIRLKSEDIADMSGTTLFTVSRIKWAWVEMNIVGPEHRAMVIRDIETFMSAAEKVPASVYARHQGRGSSAQAKNHGVPPGNHTSGRSNTRSAA